MQPSAETRELLIAAATTLFAKRGIHWVSFQMIASEIGVSQPSLYKHFSDKDDLILACAKRAAEHGRSLIDKGIDPLESSDVQLRQYIEGNLYWAEKFPEQAAIILAIYYFAYNSAEIKKMFIALNTASEQRLQVRIVAGERERLWGSRTRLRGTLNLEIERSIQQARALHSLLMGEMIKMVQSPREHTRQQRLDLIWTSFMAVLGASGERTSVAVRSPVRSKGMARRPKLSKNIRAKS